MFDQLFARFKKVELSKPDKQIADLDTEFMRIKKAYADIATSDLYNLISEYFLVKIDLNRDAMDTKNPLSEEGRIKIVELQAENRIMRKFIEDIEAMRDELQGKNETEAIV